MITELAKISSSEPIALPPRQDVAIRPATLADLPFIDQLQKLHAKQVGWMPTKQLEGKIKAGHVIVAESGQCSVVGGQKRQDPDIASLELATDHRPLATPVGYCIGHDQYFKRDDLGIIYQLNVLPTKQRGLIGATLIKAMFERAAYGCRLFCCWCAQDIEANHFWESIGFVPLAFRAGSRGKGPKGGPRVHIFWQRRIRAGDTATPYWFPSQTTSGAIREDRIVLPIPPGTHWSDAKPIVLPGCSALETEPKRLLAPRQKRTKTEPAIPRRAIESGGLRLAVPTESASQPKPKREPRATCPEQSRRKARNDPKLIAAARELRDRWLERVNADPLALSLQGKYDISKELAAPKEVLQLPQPIAA